MAQKRSYSGDILRQGDSNRYLISLFARPEARPPLWALFAFNLELARTRDVASEKMLALIRLQWWREALEALEKGEVRHQILQDLSPFISPFGEGGGDHMRHLHSLISAREEEIENEDALNGVESIEAFLEKISLPLMKMADALNGGQEDDNMIRQTSKAYMLSSLLMAAPYERARLNAHMSGIQDHVRDVVSRAQEMNAVRPVTALFRAQGALTDLQLGRIKKAGCALDNPALLKPVPFKELRIFFKTLDIHNS